MLQPLQNPQQSLQMQIQWATVGSLEDWYNYLFDKMPLETNRLLKLKNITEMVNFLTNDLRETCGKFQKHFQDCLGLDYSRYVERNFIGFIFKTNQTRASYSKKVYVLDLEGLLFAGLVRIGKKHKRGCFWLCFLKFKHLRHCTL